MSDKAKEFDKHRAKGASTVLLILVLIIGVAPWLIATYAGMFEAAAAEIGNRWKTRKGKGIHDSR